MSKTILAVDDSATMLQTMSLVLEREGYQVLTACDGVDGLKKLEGGDRVSVIITDLNMPNMDGITFTQEVRKLPKYKFVPIIMVTTESAGVKKDAGKAAGATGWIVKPFQPEQLISVIKKVCP